MLGKQYYYMGRYFVAVGETNRGIVAEPTFIETTEDGRVLTPGADRIDGWYFSVPTGRRFGVPRPLPAVLPEARATTSQACR